MDSRLCVLPRTNPGLFPLSSSLEVKRIWESWVHHSFSPLPPRAMLCQKSTYLHWLHLYCLKFNIVQGGKEEVVSPVLLLLYVKCPTHLTSTVRRVVPGGLEVKTSDLWKWNEITNICFRKKLLLNLKFVNAIGQGATFVQHHVLFLEKKLGSIHPGAYVMV